MAPGKADPDLAQILRNRFGFAKRFGGTGFDTKLSPKVDGYVRGGVKRFRTGGLAADYVMVRSQAEVWRP